MIRTADPEAPAREVRPSVGAWLQTAGLVAESANDAGAYDGLLACLRAERRR